MRERNAGHETLRTVPSGQSEMETAVRDEFRGLRNEYSAENVLVLTGVPTSTEMFREHRSDDGPGTGVLRVSPFVVHTTDVVNSATDKAILSDTLRRDHAHRLIADKDRETEYFQRAAELDSFAGAVAKLVKTTTWQGGAFDETPVHVEIQSVIDEFHNRIAESSHIEDARHDTETAADDTGILSRVTRLVRG